MAVQDNPSPSPQQDTLGDDMIELPRFKERKTTQLAALLTQHSGGEINIYKLLNMIYIIDRKALEQWGRPVTFDAHSSLPLGPTPENTYDLIKGKYGETWSRIFSERIRGNHFIRLERKNVEYDELSQAEIDLAMQVFEKIHPLTFGQIKEIVHQFPEHKDPEGSSHPIDIEDILKAVGWDGDDLEDIKMELQAAAYKERVSE